MKRKRRKGRGGNALGVRKGRTEAFILTTERKKIRKKGGKGQALLLSKEEKEGEKKQKGKKEGRRGKEESEMGPCRDRCRAACSAIP